MKKTSIRHKITKSFLLVGIVSLGVSVTIMLLMLFNMHGLLEEAGKISGETAANVSSNILIERAIQDTQELLSAKAELIEFHLDESIQLLNRISSYLAILYNREGEFYPVYIPNFHEVEQGLRSAHWFVQEGLLESPHYDERDLDTLGLREESYLLGVVLPFISSLMEQRTDISSVFIQTVTGLNVHYDDQAYEKAHYLHMPILQEREWYVKVRDEKTRFISDTYEDAFGRGLCITVAYPVFNQEGQFVAAVGFDFLIEAFSHTINQMVVGSSGYAMLIGHDHIIAAPGIELSEDRSLPDFWAYITDDTSGYILANVSGEDYYILWNRIYISDWTVVYVLPTSSIFDLATAMKLEINTMTNQVIADTNRDFIILITLMSGLLILILAAVFVSVDILAKRISNPIVRLSNDAKRIGMGDEDRELISHTGDEIEDLASTFNQMVRDIKRITGDKERISTELELAKRIQNSLLPRTFSAVADRGDLELYASMLPCTEVGGDFYDFFFINEETFAFVMADVSGSGVPASLFMVITRTLIRNNAMNGLPPCEVFVNVNRILCEHNMESIFVTAFMGYLDLPTGELTYVNAGHNPPLLRRDGFFAWLKINPGFILAGDDMMTYRQSTITLSKDEMILLYTDGITEAMNPEYELYGEERFFELLNEEPLLKPKDLIHKVIRQVEQYAGGSNQADDITIMAIQYIGGSIIRINEIITLATLDHIPEITEFVEIRISDFAIEVQQLIAIVIDEVISNIAKYSYIEEIGMVRVQVHVTKDEITLTFIDDGEPFNPLRSVDPQIHAPLEERDEGGLGLFLIRGLMDEVNYERIGHSNVFTVSKVTSPRL